MSDINQIRRFVNGPKCFKASRYCLMDGVSDESSAITALRNAAQAAGGRVQVWFEPGVYNLSSPKNAFALFSNLEIIADGAEFVVGSVSTSGWDLSAVNVYTYDNAIFSFAAAPTIENFKWYGGKFTITPTQLAPLQIGDSGSHTSGPQAAGRITIDGLEQDGGNTILVLRCDDISIDRLKQRNTLGNAIDVSASTGNIRFPRHEFIGVDAGKTQWNNCQAIVAGNIVDMVIQSPRAEYTGGTAYILRSGTDNIRRARINDIGVTAAGNAAAGISVASFAATGSTVEQSGVFGGFVRGYLCGVDGGNGGNDAHDGITLASLKGGSSTFGVCNGPKAKDIDVDFLSPDETFNYTTYTVSGSANPRKNTLGTSIGISYGVQVTGTDQYAPVIMPQVIGVTVRHAKRGAFGFSRCIAPVLANSMAEWCGWERDGSNLPLGPAHGAYIENCAEAQVVNNTIRQHNPGCSGSGSASTMLILNKDSYATWIAGNQLRGNEGTAWNNAAICHTDTAATFAGVNATNFGFTSRTCSTLVGRNVVYGTNWNTGGGAGGHVRYFGGSAGHVTVSDDDYIARVTGTGTTDINHGALVVLYNHASGTPTCRLPSAATVPGQRVTVKHMNAGGGNLAVSAAVGSVVGATTLAAGEFAIYLAEGANWQQVA